MKHSLTKLTICLLAAIVLATSLQAQTPDTLWSRLYGDRPGWDGYDMLYGATRTYDGGFAMNGYSTTNGDTIKGDQWVVKINADGDTLWTATFGNFDRRDYGRDIIETYDHNLVICGHGRIANTSEPYRIRLFKADSLGNEIWGKDYVGANGFSTEAIVETADSGFAIVGWTDDKDVFLFRADSLGDSLWSQTYGGPGDDVGYDLCEMDDGGFMLVGMTESYGLGSYDIYVIRTDSNGDTLWTHTFGTASYDEGRAIAPTHDGNYMIAGSVVNTNADVFLVKIQPDGDTLWTKSVGQDAANDAAYGISTCQDNGFLIAGRNYNAVNYYNDMYVLKIDANGDSLWSYSHVNNIHDEGHVALEVPDVGIYLFGTRAASSSGSYRDYWAVALDFPVGIADDIREALPSDFGLRQNYPNPFNPSTTIEYTIPSRSFVTIEIVDLLGRQIRSLVHREQPAGTHRVMWDGRTDDGSQVATGVYFYRLKAGDFTDARKMLLLK